MGISAAFLFCFVFCWAFLKSILIGGGLRGLRFCWLPWALSRCLWKVRLETWEQVHLKHRTSIAFWIVLPANDRWTIWTNRHSIKINDDKGVFFDLAQNNDAKDSFCIGSLSEMMFAMLWLFWLIYFHEKPWIKSFGFEYPVNTIQISRAHLWQWT